MFIQLPHYVDPLEFNNCLLYMSLLHVILFMTPYQNIDIIEHLSQTIFGGVHFKLLKIVCYFSQLLFI